MRSVGELVLHIADGRVDWFSRIGAPGCDELLAEIEHRPLIPSGNPGKLVVWLDRTWSMIASTLAQWTVDDLAVTYEHGYQGKVYAVSRQWTIWRIMAHDIHHGGQLSELLATQGIVPLELTLLGVPHAGAAVGGEETQVTDPPRSRRLGDAALQPTGCRSRPVLAT